MRRSKKLKSRGPAPLPSLLYKASTTARRREEEGPSCKRTGSGRRRKGAASLHRKAGLVSSPIPIFFTTGRRRGQARRGGAPPQLHRATATPPRHHLLIAKDADDLKLFFLNLLNCRCSSVSIPVFVPCFPCFLCMLVCCNIFPCSQLLVNLLGSGLATQKRVIFVL